MPSQTQPDANIPAMDVPDGSQLPKPGDFQPSDLGNAAMIARIVSLVAAQAAGMPQQAAQLTALYARQDEQRKDSARADYEQALQRALAETDIQFKAREDLRSEESLALSKRNLELAENADRRAEESLDLERQKTQAQLDQYGREEADRAFHREQVGRASVAQANIQFSDWLEKEVLAQSKVGGLKAADLISPIDQQVIMAEPDPKKRVAKMTEMLKMNQSVIDSAFPGMTAEELSQKINTRIELDAGSIVGEEYQQLFRTQALLYGNTYTAKLKAGAKLSPEEAASAMNEIIAPQIEQAFADNRMMTADEGQLIVNWLQGAELPTELTFDLFSKAVNQGVLKASIRLGLDPQEQEAMALGAATALYDAIERGELNMSGPFTLRGQEVKATKNLMWNRQNMMQEKLRAEAEGRPIDALRIQGKIEALDKRIQGKRNQASGPSLGTITRERMGRAKQF